MNFIDTIFGSIIKKVRFFRVLQFVWIIEFYYFGYMSLSGLFKKYCSVYRYSSEFEYRLKMILTYFEKYNEYVLSFAIILFLSGIFAIFFKDIIWIKEYESVSIYCDIGVELSVWLFLIYSTYKMYMFFGVLFLLFPLLIWSIYMFLKYLQKKITPELIKYISFCICVYLIFFIIVI